MTSVPYGSGDAPARHAAALDPEAVYVVLTPLRPDSGMVLGRVRAVAEAEAVRLMHGPEVPGALLAVYVRVADELVQVEVESATLPGSQGTARCWVRTWVDGQLLSQDSVDVLLDR